MENLKVNKLIDSYSKKIACATEINNIKNIATDMFLNDNISDIDLEWIFYNHLIKRLKGYFNIDILHLSKLQDISCYEYIIRNYTYNKKK